MHFRATSPARASSTQGPLTPNHVMMMSPHLHATAVSQIGETFLFLLPPQSP